MDPIMVATFVITCLLLYRVINGAIKILRIVLWSDYPSNTEDILRLPFIGHAYFFIDGTEALFNRAIKVGNIYSTTVRLSVGHHSVFVVTIPEHLKEVLLSPKTIEKNFCYDFGRLWLGDGLLTAPASIWEAHRKLLHPFFNSLTLKSSLETFVTQSVTLAKKIEPHLDGPEFEISRYISLCTLDTICVAAMGINLDAQESEKCQYHEAGHKVLAGFAKRTLSPWLYPDFIFYRTQLGKDHRKHIEFLHEFVDNVIRQKKAEIARRSDQRVSADEEQDTADASTAEPQSLMENLLKLSNDSKTLTDEQVRSHVDTMMVAGSDSSAITLNYLTLMLASHQDIQQKVYQELCEIFGEHVLEEESEELHITMEVLTKMTYMERVIKETMRLFPVGPLLFRKATEDLVLGDCTVPRGSSVVLNVIGVHRNEKYWSEPLKFDPDRFLPEKIANQEPFSYLPFSGGRRNCIGIKYAMMFMKIFTTTVLRKYFLIKDKVVPVEDLRLKIDTLLRSVDPDTLRIKRRAKKYVPL
ncbi:cytochrome P450 4C1-like [Diprion similis]|uniref:cytochrome P450 4C1-like n=1 Tax=Diprion similis TaxID=362088 RepID=UPI001EF75683|nr:cytochrome P450 4C1-like [Diprion similis]